MPDRRDMTDPVVLQVHGGELRGEGSWVYAWLRLRTGRVLYVGATGLHPELRAWLHLHDPEPGVGRIAARYPAWREQDLEVVAFPVPQSVPRRVVKQVLIQRLQGLGLLDDAYVGEPAEGRAAPHEVGELVEVMVKQLRRRSRSAG